MEANEKYPFDPALVGRITDLYIAFSLIEA